MGLGVPVGSPFCEQKALYYYHPILCREQGQGLPNKALFDENIMGIKKERENQSLN
jgi:hypothetical protein